MVVSVKTGVAYEADQLLDCCASLETAPNLIVVDHCRIVPLRARIVKIVTDLAPTGVLRASINLGNPVLAQGTADDPTAVTVDIAREIGRRLNLMVDLICFDAARKSYEAMATGQADICFLAIEPARAADVAFTEPYVVIEGVFAVPTDSPFIRPEDVDRVGTSISVKPGSAYDLYLTRTLKHATIVRDDTDADVRAGIRQPMTDYVATHPGMRLIDERFMQIRQAVGTTKTRDPETIEYLRATLRELKSSGFVADALERSGQSRSLVAH